MVYIKKPPSCKKVGGPKTSGEKRGKIKGDSQEMAVIMFNGKKFKNNNSGEFVCLPPLGLGTKFT